MNRFVDLFEELSEVNTELWYRKEKQSKLSHGKTISNFPTPKAIFETYRKIYDGRFINNKVTNWATNECSIRLSWALHQLGVDTSGSGDYRRMYSSNRSGPVQPSARALAKWLAKNLKQPQKLDKGNTQYKKSDFYGKEGILYFVHPEHGGNGYGHIDIFYNNDIGSGFYKNSKIWFWEYNNGW